MSSKYKNSKRCYLIDHHSPQPPVVTLDQLNITEYEQFFDTSHIDSLMVYCKDHWGVTYYDSKVEGARKHQGLKTDWIQEISTVLKKKRLNLLPITALNTMKVLQGSSLSGGQESRMALP